MRHRVRVPNAIARTAHIINSYLVYLLVLTSGGGSNNPQWTALRQRMLGVPTARAANIDAAFGAASVLLVGTAARFRYLAPSK